MDKTEQNIKMCEKAVKIQEAWEPKEGDYAYSQRGGVYVLFTQVILIGDALGRFKFDHTWLPRQDQLQEMAWKDIVEKDPLRGICVPRQKPEILILKFKQYVFGDGSYLQLETLEQLWLAFVMQEKFNKTWNGEEWIEAE